MKEAEIEAEGGVASNDPRTMFGIRCPFRPIPSLNEREHVGRRGRTCEEKREGGRERETGERNLFYRDVGEGSTRFD